MSMTYSRGPDHLRALRAELADLRQAMGLCEMPGLAHPGKSAAAVPRPALALPERSWSWPNKAERDARRSP